MKDSIFAGIILSIAGFASIGVMQPLNGIVFSFGLFIITLLQLSLFTGDILKAKNGINKGFIIHCTKAYIGNFIGCFIFAYLITFCSETDHVQVVAENKANLCFLPALIKGIFCNMMVCTAAFLASRSNDLLLKFVSIMVPITLFILCGFEHSIANMSFLLIAGCNLFNLIPVTIGNIIGGLIVVYMVDKFRGNK